MKGPLDSTRQLSRYLTLGFNARDPYSVVPQDDREAEPEVKTASRTSKKHRTIIILICLAISLILTSILVSTISRIPPTQGPQPLFRCGTSAAEARSRGCQFDLMSFSWLPPACYDEELTNEFLNYTNWTWTFDRRGDNPISTSDVRTGDFGFLFTRYEYHIVHCTFMWKKMHRAIQHGDLSRIDGYIAESHHTDHCRGTLLNHEDDMQSWGTMGLVKFPACGADALKVRNGWYRVENGELIWGIGDAHALRLVDKWVPLSRSSPASVDVALSY